MSRLTNMQAIDLRSRDSALFTRIPPNGIKEALKNSARKSGRSLTEEVVMRLLHSLIEKEVISSIPSGWG